MGIDDFGRPGTISRRVADVLEDQKFHCRTCLIPIVGSDQIAGGSGIQGLKRKGYDMTKETKFCTSCQKKTTWDRWTGKRLTITATGAGNISTQLKRRVYEYYAGRDPILDTQLHQRYALVDHRLPMIRWGNWTPSSDPQMSETMLEATFQLLRNSEGQNHNLLKSRACESCVNTGIRPPFHGFKFWYDGRGPMWPQGVPEKGEQANEGCRGCGWYNALEWKNAANRNLEQQEAFGP
jgi:hypothetical protein